MPNAEITLFKNITNSFKTAFEETSLELINEKLNCIDLCDQKNDDGNNVSILIGITGSLSGRLLLSANYTTVNNFVKKMNSGMPLESEDETGFYFAEFANMICGKALSSVNNTTDNLKLWLSPPVLLTGEDIAIVNHTQKLHSEKLQYSGTLGDIILNIGLKKGE